MWNAKTSPTGKEEMNVQRQMPKGLLQHLCRYLVILQENGNSQNYCVNIKSGVGFSAGGLKIAFS